MQLAFSTNAYLKYSFAEAVRRLAQIGYAGVEIMADVPHAWPAYLLDEQKQAIRQALADNGLAISNINAPATAPKRISRPTIGSPNRPLRRRVQPISDRGQRRRAPGSSAR